MIRDEGEAYARELTAASVRTKCACDNVIVHEFMMLTPRDCRRDRSPSSRRYTSCGGRSNRLTTPRSGHSRVASSLARDYQREAS
jgi:hypothetical protein